MARRTEEWRRENSGERRQPVRAACPVRGTSDGLMGWTASGGGAGGRARPAARGGRRTALVRTAAVVAACARRAEYDEGWRRWGGEYAASRCVQHGAGWAVSSAAVRSPGNPARRLCDWATPRIRERGAEKVDRRGGRRHQRTKHTGRRQRRRCALSSRCRRCVLSEPTALCAVDVVSDAAVVSPLRDHRLCPSSPLPTSPGAPPGCASCVHPRSSAAVCCASTAAAAGLPCPFGPLGHP